MQSSGSLGQLSTPHHRQITESSTAREKMVHFEPYPPAREKETELDPKTAAIYKQIHELYQHLKTCTIDEISKSMGIDPVAIFEKRENNKKPDIDTLLQGLKYYLLRMLKYHTNLKEIGERKRDRSGLQYGNDELISIIETDLKTALREQEKLKLVLETSQMKIKALEKKNEELSSQTKRQVAEVQTERSRLKSQLKNQNEQLKVLQEENLIFQRPTTSRTSTAKKGRHMRPLKNALFLKDENERVPVVEAISSVKSANATTVKEDLKMITTQMDQNKLHNLQTKQDLKEFRRKMELSREKEMTDKQKDLLISRLTIQVTERDKDIARIKTDYDQIFLELKRMKEKDAERERAEWTKEVLSDKNPHTVEYYKKKLEAERVEITDLKKQIRKYALGEKKVFIKEKAFELERAEYQDKLGYLQDRVTKLIKINDDIKKSKDDTSVDKFRKRRETNLNKSFTSSDDMESRPAGGYGADTLGLTPDSFGKSPKLGFDKRPSGKSTKMFFH